MPDVIDDTGENLAHWLREVARGSVAPESLQPPKEPGDVVIEHLETRVGRTLRSRAAVDVLLKDLALAESRARERGTRRGILRGTVLLSLLAAAVLHYYYWTVSLEINSLPCVDVYGLAQPAPNGTPKPR